VRFVSEAAVESPEAGRCGGKQRTAREMEKLQALEVSIQDEGSKLTRAKVTDWEQKAFEKIVLDPQYHDILTLVKGIRNGIVYGTKVRFPHALVYVSPPRI
jgi:hypothetical protein